MKVRKAIDINQFEGYKIDLLRIKRKYALESIEIKRRLLNDKIKMINKSLRP